ncbi:hypothetical protein [Aliiglaciecola lipolytica]|uniref:NIPSNAP domain-containing protein n=1 Tax=Aliiglaciecola lipolytica E3 TaxID=1127673 RepID=K6X5D7_9ALTE|nr:hypothetical protein [Aliiglaciecola lipolytica]GAC15814.1 hypothetical protein GLIP_3197 [Aliiglaciecola lipolytica E3]
MKKVTNLIYGVIICLLTFSSSSLMADERVFKNGDYWEVTSVEIEDGQWLTYAKHLADEWRSSMEFAKSKKWIKEYKVVYNVHARDGEADLYLITIFDKWASLEEEESRFTEWMEWSKESLSKLEEESGDRAKIRRLMSDSLLQELHFRD